MSTRRLEDRVGPITKLAIGYLPGRKLSFDKRSIDKSGKCDCAESADQQERVYGVLFELNAASRAELDRAEGAGRGYQAKIVTVRNAAGELFDGVLTYVADPDYKDGSLEPYDWYKEHVLSGAREHGLPSEYTARYIEAVRSKPDPDRARAHRERLNNRNV